MNDTAKNINLNILLNSIPKAENLLRQFAAAFNIPYTNHKIVRAKLQQEYEKRIFPPINNKVKGEVRTRLRAKWQREGKDTSGNLFDTHVNLAFDEWTKLGRDKEHRRRSQEQQRINSCYDIIEGNRGPETNLPSGFEMDNDGESQTPSEGPNTDNAPCHKCGKKQSTSWRKRRPPKNQWYCIDCWNKVPNCPYPGCHKKGWKVSKETGNERFCSDEHLKEWLKDKENRKGPPKPKTKQQYLQELVSLPGWELLTEDEKDKFKSMINNSFLEKDWKNAIQQTKIKIADRRKENGDEDEESDDDNDANLDAKIQKAIQEIEAELNKEPKITLTNDNWRTYIAASSDENKLQSRKKEILDKIHDIRRQQPSQNLTELRTQATHLIQQELQKNPPVDKTELINSNWETEINQASNEKAINEIRDRVLADIRNKRATKQEKSALQELLNQAKQPANWDNYQNLATILQAIKKLHSSNAYQEKVEEIQAIEEQCQKLNPNQYQEDAIKSLDQQAQENGLNESNMDEETKAAIAAFKADPTLEKKAQAEEKISQNGANNNLNNLITKTLNKLQKGTLTKEEKDQVIIEIMQFATSDNTYQAKAYKKYKDQVDQLLAKLRSEGQKQEEPGISWSKVLGVTVLIVLPLIAITLLILRIRKRKLNRK